MINLKKILIFVITNNIYSPKLKNTTHSDEINSIHGEETSFSFLEEEDSKKNTPDLLTLDPDPQFSLIYFKQRNPFLPALGSFTIQNELKLIYKNKQIHQYLKNGNKNLTTQPISERERNTLLSFIEKFKTASRYKLKDFYQLAIKLNIIEISTKLNLYSEDAFYINLLKKRGIAEEWLANSNFIDKKILEISDNDFFEILSVTTIEEWDMIKNYIQAFLISFLKKQKDPKYVTNNQNQDKVYMLYQKIKMAQTYQCIKIILEQTKYDLIVRLICSGLRNDSPLFDPQSSFEQIIVFLNTFFLFFI